MGHLPKTQTQLYSDLNTTNNNLSRRNSPYAESTSGASYGLPDYSYVLGNAGNKKGTASEDVYYIAVDAKGRLYGGAQVNNAIDITWEKTVTKDDLSNYWSLISSISISEKADMNSFMTPGNYSCDANTTVKTLSNCPVTQAFLMKVYYPINGGNYIIQEYTPNDGGLIVRRVYDGYSKTWTMKKVVFS